MSWSPRVQRAVAIYAIAIVLLVMFAVLSLATPTFLTQRNLVNLLDQLAAVGILTCAETLVIISGSFDLSVTAVMAMSGITAVLAAPVVGAPLAFGAAVLVGLSLGALNGLVVHFGRVNAFIATLATSIVFRGSAIVITGGVIMKAEADGFGILGVDWGILQITGAGWLFVVVAVASGLLLARTTYGRAIYAVGGNIEAARLAGIRVGLTRVTVFMLSGGMAALAGLIYASRNQAAHSNMALGLELTAIASTVVGGTSILGGEGAIWRGLMGACILALIGNGMNLLSINSTYQQVVQGVLILVAVVADQVVRRRR